MDPRQASKDLQIMKIENKLNPADLMAKHFSREEIRQMMDGLDNRHSIGRNADAPELSTVKECKRIHSEQLTRSTSQKDSSDGKIKTCVDECIA